MKRFCDNAEVVTLLRGRRVAVVGSGPGVLDNRPGFVDGHDVVVRVNNWKLGLNAGHRVDVFYSFFGGSIKKTAAEAKAAGVRLCMCKCPDAKVIESPWHDAMRKQRGVDFRFIYRDRAKWWFCPTYVPPLEQFLAHFELLDRHVPTTGFSAILDVLACEPASLYLTGFDGFTSMVHNINEAWRPGDPRDPIGHRPDLELAWLAVNRHRFTADSRLGAVLGGN